MAIGPRVCTLPGPEHDCFAIHAYIDGIAIAGINDYAERLASVPLDWIISDIYNPVGPDRGDTSYRMGGSRQLGEVTTSSNHSPDSQLNFARSGNSGL